MQAQDEYYCNAKLEVHFWFSIKEKMLRNIFLEYFMHLIKQKLISTLLTAHPISMQLMVTMHWFPNSSKFSYFNNQHRLIGSVIGGRGIIVNVNVDKNSSSCQGQNNSRKDLLEPSWHFIGSFLVLLRGNFVELGTLESWKKNYKNTDFI